jgi:hypothetical protein
MKTLKSLALVFGVGLFLLAVGLNADEWDKKTIISFSGPVQVADTQLPAGTYVFKLANTADRHIVQIFNQDETQIIATIMATPDYRLTPTDNTVIKFAETSNGSEASGILPVGGIPIKEWFYPGDGSGEEFRVKPEEDLAAAQTPDTPESAPAAVSAPATQSAPAPTPQVEAPQQPASTPEATAPPVDEQADSAAQDATPQTGQTAPAADQQAAPTDLPKTASQMPLAGLIGVIALAAGASLRFIFKVSA